MKLFYSLLFILAGTTILQAELPSDTFKLANDAYEHGAIDDAIHLYESIMGSQYTSAVLYYNLGTAYIEKQKWAEARYYLEKARLADPNQEGVIENLNYVQKQIDDLYEFPYFPFTNIVEYIHSTMGWSALTLSLLAFFLLVLGTIWVRPLKHWKSLAYALTACWILLFCLFLLEWNYARMKNKLAIVWEGGVDLREKPDDFGEPIATLEGGFKVRVLEQVGPWCRVDLADGSAGWILGQSIKSL
jgi:tetratricopeptide (TPR) repeat protein